MKRLKYILFLLLSVTCILAQSPKREMRATWLATVWQIDWPSSVVSSTGNTVQINAQKDLMIRMLDSLVSANMNAVCFQVRSRCDAMYNSAYEPWSTDLVATRGQNPGYDPLQFVIDEGHKRGLEVHAWLNPYRYETAVNQWTGQAGDYRTAHPEWILSYSGGTCILDPGNPAVVKRIKQVVGDIIQKYDIDGILFDDYFYAYGGTPATLDASSQALYKPAGMNVDDWRRANVNKMIAEVYDTIQVVKPYVRFGVSPFGIWTTDGTAAAKDSIALPSGITGGNMYAEIYCDPIAWLKQGKVDYVSPQLYWPTGGSQDYGKLSPWWSAISNQFGKHFYSSQDLSGLAASNYAPSLKNSKRNLIVNMNGQRVNLNSLTLMERNIAFANPQRVSVSNFSQEEIGKQITLNRSSDENNAPGSIFFSTKPFYTTKGFVNYLKKYQFTQKAIVPAIDWKQRTELGLVSNISLLGNTLSWTSPVQNVRYAVYAIPNNKIASTGNFSISTFLQGVAYSTSFIVPANVSTSTNTFAVSILDRFGNEYPVQIKDQLKGTSVTVNMISPTNGETKIMPFNFTWQVDTSVDSYLLEIAEDINFSKIVCSRELITGEFSTTLLDVLKTGRTYYWRVKTRKPNTFDGVSEIRSFIPQRFSISDPQSGSVNASLTPTINWQNAGLNSSYLIEIATSNQFVQSTIVYSQTVSTNSFAIPPKVLSGATNYFVRVSTDILGVKTISDIVNFTTLTVVPDVPVLLTPTMNSSVFGTEIKVTWKEGISSGYWVEMSKDITFPVRSTTIKTVGAYIYETTFTGLLPADYYFRARAIYSGSTYTNWSDMLKITLKNITGIDEFNIGSIGYKIQRNNDSEISLILNSSETTNVSISLIALSGIRIQQLCVNRPLMLGTNSIEIPIINLAKGLYLIEIKTDKDSYVLKIIR